MANIKYSKAIRDAITEEMRRDPRVFVMGEDVERFGGVFGCTLGIPEEFGSDRIRSTPISEAAFVGAGLGMAITGARPVVELQYVDFIMCAMDQLVNQIAKIHYMSNGRMKVPYTLRVQQGCGRGNGAQHAQSFESLFANIPGLKVVCPSTPAVAKGLLKTAIRDDNPVVFCEHKMLYAMRGEVPDNPDFTLPFGQAATLREGTDVTIIATAYMVARALEAADTLAREGISAEVIDPRTIVPLDENALIRSAEKTGHIVIVHETNEFCGFGAEIAFRVQNRAFRYLDAPIERVTTAQVPMPYARCLENANVPDAGRIVAAAKRTLYLDNGGIA
ncbi:MAG: alpha-ketoacid dehydrogenase subunit beta [Eubacteriales bacterium]|nr:alpha-ketoacid dehydrogenase subunit beta [Eubacteriales bacterium]